MLEEVLDKKFDEYQSVVLGAVDFKFQRMEERIDVFEEKARKEMSEIRGEIRNLTNTLEHFLHRLTNYRVHHAFQNKLSSVQFMLQRQASQPIILNMPQKSKMGWGYTWSCKLLKFV